MWTKLAVKYEFLQSTNDRGKLRVDKPAEPTAPDETTKRHRVIFKTRLLWFYFIFNSHQKNKNNKNFYILM